MKSSPKNKLMIIYASALSLLLLAIILGACIGSTSINVIDAIGALLRGDTGAPEARILLYARLPRLLATLACGTALAVAGAVIQGVLANNLASPSIIGVNAGAGLAVTICSAFEIFSGIGVSLFAFLGAFLTVTLISVGAKKWGASRGTVILLGVAINALLGAISDSIITLFPDVSVMSNSFRIGDFSFVTYSKVIPAAILILVSVIIVATLSNELEVLTLGEDSARSLGLNANAMRVIFLLLSALLAGSAVSVCGLLSFVGLLVPHAVRRMGISQSKHLILLSALFGAGFVSICDTLSRALFAPYELPVGIIMAFLGAPFFIFILIKGKGGRSRA